MSRFERESSTSAGSGANNLTGQAMEDTESSKLRN